MQPKEIADLLNLETVTVRRLSQEIEQAGWEFKKNEAGRREYEKRDILLFTRIRELMKQSGVIQSSAVKMAVEERLALGSDDDSIIAEADDRSHFNALQKQDLERFEALMKEGIGAVLQEMQRMREDLARIEAENAMWKDRLLKLEAPKEDRGFWSRVLGRK